MIDFVMLFFILLVILTYKFKSTNTDFFSRRKNRLVSVYEIDPTYEIV